MTLFIGVSFSIKKNRVTSKGTTQFFSCCRKHWVCKFYKNDHQSLSGLRLHDDDDDAKPGPRTWGKLHRRNTADPKNISLAGSPKMTFPLFCSYTFRWAGSWDKNTYPEKSGDWKQKHELKQKINMSPETAGKPMETSLKHVVLDLRVPTYACCANGEDANGHGDGGDPKKCRNCSGTSANLAGNVSNLRFLMLNLKLHHIFTDCSSLGFKNSGMWWS